MGRQRSSDSAIVQLVLALEKASVAAAKREISVVKGAGWLGVVLVLLVAEVSDGVSLGSWLEVMGAGLSPCAGGVEGGVGGAFDSVTARRFCSPLMFGTRKLYAIDWVAGGGCPRMWSSTCAELAIYRTGIRMVSFVILASSGGENPEIWR